MNEDGGAFSFSWFLGLSRSVLQSRIWTSTAVKRLLAQSAGVPTPKSICSTGCPKIKSALGYLTIVSTFDSQEHLRGPNRF